MHRSPRRLLLGLLGLLGFLGLLSTAARAPNSAGVSVGLGESFGCVAPRCTSGSAYPRIGCAVASSVWVRWWLLGHLSKVEVERRACRSS